MKKQFDAILDELRRTLADVSSDSAMDLVKAITDAERIFVGGAGRSGLAVKGFAMRLMHMGFDAHVVGEIVTPGISEKDLFLIGSGSGATQSLVANAERARAEGAVVCLLTIREDSPIGRLANIILTIPASLLPRSRKILVSARSSLWALCLNRP